jgi:hypothetical protein
MSDPLQCTYTDAARNHLRDGIRLSTAEHPGPRASRRTRLTTARAAFVVLALDRLHIEITPRQNRRAGMARRSVCEVALVIRNSEDLPAC